MELNRFNQYFSIIKDIRGSGLVIAIEFHKDVKWIQNELLKSSFIVIKRGGNEVLLLDLALTTHENDINSFFKELNLVFKV